MNKVKNFLHNYWWIIPVIIIIASVSPQEKLSKSFASAIVAGVFGAIIALFNKLSSKSSENDEDIITINADSANKTETKDEDATNDKEENKDKCNNKKALTFSYILLIMVVFWTLTDSSSYNRGSSYSSSYNRSPSYNTQKINDYKLQQVADVVVSDLNEKVNKYNSNAELYEELKKQVKDNDDTAIKVFYGFIISAEVTKEYCASAGYIPEKYINAINSYKKNTNPEEELKKSFINMGANNNQAIILVNKLTDTVKKQLTKIIDRDYQDFKRINPSSTKIDYCKFYDLNAEEIVSYKISEIKKTTPFAYKKYWQR